MEKCVALLNHRDVISRSSVYIAYVFVSAQRLQIAKVLVDRCI